MSFHEQEARASVGYKAAIATAYKKIVSLFSEFFNNAARVAFVSVTNMKRF